MIILTSWAILTAFFVALCIASGRRDEEERQALANVSRNAAEPEFLEAVPTPERSVTSLSFNLKSS
jgi:hypothetical protein